MQNVLMCNILIYKVEITRVYLLQFTVHIKVKMKIITLLKFNKYIVRHHYPLYKDTKICTGNPRNNQ